MQTGLLIVILFDPLPSGIVYCGIPGSSVTNFSILAPCVTVVLRFINTQNNRTKDPSRPHHSTIPPYVKTVLILLPLIENGDITVSSTVASASPLLLTNYNWAGVDPS